MQVARGAISSGSNRAIGRLQSGNHPPLAIAIARNRPPACNRLHKFPAQIVLSVSDLKLLLLPQLPMPSQLLAATLLPEKQHELLC